MTFIKLEFKPGVNRDQTAYSNEGSWYAGNNIRFRSGYPQKIGGWSAAATSTFIGYCRQMWNWVSSYGDNLLALGTNEKFYVEVGGTYYDITPLRDTTPTISTPTSNNCIFTNNGIAKITVTLGTAHGASTGDYVVVSGVGGTTIGGIPVSEINGNHKVTVTSSTSFTFDTTTAATSTVASAGGVVIVLSFEISPGYAISTAGYGWGAGTWSRGVWSGGSTVPIALPQRDWFVNNFDNDLVMNIRNGEGYWWTRGVSPDPTTPLGTKAVRLTDYATAEGFTGSAVPVKIMQLMVSQQDRHLIAFGAVPFGSTSASDFDPLLIRWADQDTPGDWTPSVTNTAGDLRVSRGSAVIAATSTRQEILVWTDTSLHTLQFLGTTDVFGLQEYSSNTSVMSSRCMATAANVVYWMGQDKFYAYTGRVETLPCTLRDHVFNNINLEQSDQVICGTNEQWNEVWWFYPTADSDYNDAYVIYNHLERIWYYGSMPRTAWLDTPMRHYPHAANTGTDNAGHLYAHESSVDADGAALEAFIESSDYDLADGEQFMLMRRLIPDLDFAGSTRIEGVTPTVTFDIKHRNFPGDDLDTEDNDAAVVSSTSVTAYTPQVFIRARARQMAIRVSSAAAGVQWQLGAPRIDVRPDGRR